ncbi:MAG: TaqI-like C-terminal specificity domain-containing protein [Acidilobus sp.]
MAKCGFDVCTATFTMSLENYLGKEWKKFGAVPTPKDVVDFMIDVAGIKKWEGLNILEPGCGFCSFTREIYCSHPNNMFWGVEINPKVYEVISKVFPPPCFRIVFGNFLLWQTDERFDLVIGNPPYGILGSKRFPIKIPEEVREKYRKLFETAKGKYNMYGFFIEKGVKLLKEGGRLVYIVPSTFMILDEFSKLREFLSRTGELDIYYLGRGVFEKNVSVSVVVVTKDPSLRGVLKLYEVRNYLTRDMKLWYTKTDYKGEIIRFENEETRKFEEGKPKLGDLFKLYVGPRSVDYYGYPRVPQPGYVCVLKGNNIMPNKIDYSHCYTDFWIPKDSVGKIRWFFTVPHIVVGDTKGGNVVAAIDDRGYPWQEQIHLIPRVSMSMDELRKVTAYLNSEEVQWYVRTLYKDITPHTTITQLKLLPLPKEYWKYMKGSVAGQ